MLLSWRTIRTLPLGLLVFAGCAKDKTSDPLARQKYLAAEQANAKDAPLAETPDILPQTYFAAGNLFVSQGQLGKAVEQYRKAIAVNHNFAAAYHRLGRTLSAAGEHEQAAQALAKAVELKPEVPLLRNDLGYELMYLERWADAEAQFRKAIEIDPKFARAHVNLGLVLSRTERFDEALAAFRTVLPETDARYNLGLLYRGQKRYAQAAEEFRKVLALDPQFPAAQVQLDQLAANLESSIMRQRDALAAANSRPEPAAYAPPPQPIEEPSNEPIASWLSWDEEVSSPVEAEIDSPAAVEFSEAVAEEITPMGPPVELQSSKVTDATAVELQGTKALDATAVTRPISAAAEGPVLLSGRELARELAAQLESEIRVFRHEALPAVVERPVELAADRTAAAPAFAADWLARELEAAYNERDCIGRSEIAALELFPARLVRDEDVAWHDIIDGPTSIVEVTHRDEPMEYEEEPVEYFEEQPADWRADFLGLEALTGTIGNEIACLKATHSPELIAVSNRDTATSKVSTSPSEPVSLFGSPVQP